MAAAYLCGIAGIDNLTLDNSASYIQHWLKKLRDDKTLIIHTTAQAQKAADFILGVPREAVGAPTGGETMLQTVA